MVDPGNGRTRTYIDAALQRGSGKQKMNELRIPPIAALLVNVVSAIVASAAIVMPVSADIIVSAFVAVLSALFESSLADFPQD